MVIQCRRESQRVKALSFHHKQPLILIALYSGHIELFDYRKCILIHKFEAHIGAARGVDFHNEEPLFVSGGDDFLIKVWNYKLESHVFTLEGHKDYIRTTVFHHEYPWILSASDDKTVCLWNWQSKTCIAKLTGHRHYVMSAQFHPSKDLIVSASLDCTARIWDISGIRKKNLSFNSAVAGDAENDAANPAFNIKSCFALSEDPAFVVKNVLWAHEKGVNYASFHPTQPLVITGSDDRLVMMWKIEESKPIDISSWSGHDHNVTCCAFHPHQELMVSCSEDYSIRVWDLKKQSVQVFRREDDRFWTLAFHPTLNLFAAGHDSGMIIFKLDRERPAFAIDGNFLYYVKDGYLRKLDFTTSKDVSAMKLKSSSSANRVSLLYNRSEDAVLITSKSKNIEDSFYDLYMVPKATDISHLEIAEGKCSSGLSAVWVARDMFAVLDCSFNIVIKNMKNEFVEEINFPHVDKLFYAGSDFLLLQTLNGLTLYDVQQKRAIKSLDVQEVKHVVWSSDMAYVTLLAKDSISICNRLLEQVAHVNEDIRVKSGAWGGNGVFIYSTKSHLKYVRCNGDHDTIRSLDLPIYITKVIDESVHYLDLETEPRVLTVDSAKYEFTAKK